MEPQICGMNILVTHSLKNAKANFTITALGNIWAVQTDTPKKQFSCYCSIKHLSAMRRASLEGFSLVWHVWWVSAVPASAEFTLLDPFMCRGMVGMLWRQKYAHFNPRRHHCMRITAFDHGLRSYYRSDVMFFLLYKRERFRLVEIVVDDLVKIKRKQDAFRGIPLAFTSCHGVIHALPSDMFF